MTTVCEQRGYHGKIDDKGICDDCWRPPSRDFPQPGPPSGEPVADESPPGAGHSRVGAGVVFVPPAPAVDPELRIMAHPHLPEAKRQCRQCHELVGQGTGTSSGRESGFCKNCRTAFDFVPKLMPGDVVDDQYVVRGALAYGGQGWIFVAQDRRVDQPCVLKGRRDTADPRADDDIRAERRSLAKLNHPDIVKIYNVVTHPQRDGDGEHRYLVMEYVAGWSLDHVAKPRGVSVTHAMAYVHAVLPALGYLHDQGYVYCDLKPENMVHHGDAVTLIDLGAAWTGGAAEGRVYATRPYVAPEMEDTGPTVATDIYAAGRTLTALVSGSSTAFSRAEPGPLPRQAYPALRRHDCLWRFHQRACAVDPRRRFADTTEMAEALLGVMCQVAAAVERGPRPRTSSRWRPPVTQLGRFTWAGLPTPILPSQPRVQNRLVGGAGADAEAAIRLAGSVGPLSWADYAALAQAHCELGDFGAASEAVEAIDPSAGQESDTTAAVDEAIDSLVGRRRDRTTAVVDAARTYLWGVVALARGDAPVAEEQFRAAYDAAPGEPACALALAAALEAMGDHDSLEMAETLYRQVATTDPTWVGAVAGRARALQGLGRAGEGARTLTQVPTVHPLRVEAMTLACRLIPPGTYEPAVAEAASTLVKQTASKPRKVSEAELAATLYEMVRAAVLQGEQVGDEVGGRRSWPSELAAAADAALRDQAIGTPNATERYRLLDQAARLRPWRTWR